MDSQIFWIAYAGGKSSGNSEHGAYVLTLETERVCNNMAIVEVRSSARWLEALSVA